MREVVVQIKGKRGTFSLNESQRRTNEKLGLNARTEAERLFATPKVAQQPTQRIVHRTRLAHHTVDSGFRSEV